MRPVLPLALLGALLAPPALAAPAQALRPTVVVALADTGVNPYHEAFYRPQNTRHPCTYVAGFDCSVPALRLSVGRFKDHAKAVEADREVWEGVEQGRWYWIPKTNIIGAVCEPYDDPKDVAGGPDTCILDGNGHGTATASSVLSEAPDALLLVHDGGSGATHIASAPVTPDIQSHSWGPPAPLPLHHANMAVEGAGDMACSYPTRRPESVFFHAAGNEAPFPAVLDCERQLRDVHVVGGGYPGHWTFASWSTADFTSWFCRPAAVHDGVKGTSEHCGTSFSAPTAAGAAAAALLRLRRQDGHTGRNTTARVSRTVSRAAFDQALRDAATYTPKAKFASGGICTDYVVCAVGSAVYGARTPLPEQAPYVFWGYGWLDSTVVDAVVSCARGRGCPQKTAEAKRWNDARGLARDAGDDVRVYSPPPQRDAGSKRDAGDDRRTALPVAAGRAYDARIDPLGIGGDVEDWYAFRAVAGQRIGVTSTASLHPALPPLPAEAAPAVGCWFLVAPDGRVLSPAGGAGLPLFSVECLSPGPHAPPRAVVAPATGTYHLGYTAHNGGPAHDYRFTLTLAR